MSLSFHKNILMLSVVLSGSFIAHAGPLLDQARIKDENQLKFADADEGHQKEKMAEVKSESAPLAVDKAPAHLAKATTKQAEQAKVLEKAQRESEDAAKHTNVLTRIGHELHTSGLSVQKQREIVEEMRDSYIPLRERFDTAFNAGAKNLLFTAGGVLGGAFLATRGITLLQRGNDSFKPVNSFPAIVGYLLKGWGW